MPSVKTLLPPLNLSLDPVTLTLTHRGPLGVQGLGLSIQGGRYIALGKDHGYARPSTDDSEGLGLLMTRHLGHPGKKWWKQETQGRQTGIP